MSFMSDHHQLIIYSYWKLNLNFSNSSNQFPKDQVIGVEMNVENECPNNDVDICTSFAEQITRLLRMRGLVNETGRR